MKYCGPLLGVALLAACSDSDSLGRTTARSGTATDIALGVGYVGDTLDGVGRIPSTGTANLRALSVDAPETLTVKVGGPERGAAPGGALPIEVSWTPAAAGVLDAQLEVETNDRETPRRTLTVRGEVLAIPSCDDGNPCTDDSFHRESETCRHVEHTRSCDDGNACTEGDRCDEGECLGRALQCDDDDVCTLDLCDPSVGCTFPPDDRICDDGDPCTRDLCDRDDGCSHPDADNYTPCGSSSCAEANVCLSGDCRTIDVSNWSDGQDCSDGDVCTEGDVCQDGECQPGEVTAQEFTVKHRTPTFGGVGSRAVSDGAHILFAEVDGLRWVHVGEDLALEATYPARAVASPARIGSTFLVPTQPGLVAFTGDHDSLDFLWEVPWPTGVPPSHFASLDARAVGAFPSGTGTELISFGADGSSLPAATLDAPLLDFAADGLSVVTLADDATRITWHDIGVDGSSAERFNGSLNSAVHRIDIDGPTQRLVALTESSVDLYQVSSPPLCMAEPDCSPPPFTLDRIAHWAHPSGANVDDYARDVAIDGDTLLASTVDSVAIQRLDLTVFSPPLAWQQLSPIGAEFVDIDEYLAFAYGEVGRVWHHSGVILENVTGSRHGSVQRLVDWNEGKIGLGIASARGIFDPTANEVETWSPIAQPLSRYRTRVYEGLTRRAALQRRSPKYSGVPCHSPVCIDMIFDSYRPDGFATSGHYASKSNSPLAATSSGLLLAPLSTGAQVEETQTQENAPSTTAPIGQLPLVVSIWHRPWNSSETELLHQEPIGYNGFIDWSLRPEDQGERFALVATTNPPIGGPPWILRVQRFEADGTPLPGGILEFNSTRLTVEPNIVATDGDTILVGDDEGVRASFGGETCFENPCVLERLPLDDIAPDTVATVPWFEGDRAFLSWLHSDGSARLTQISVDRTHETLTERGTITLEGQSSSIQPAGEMIVVSTPAEIVVARPSCLE